jgi:hypothetical protein
LKSQTNHSAPNDNTLIGLDPANMVQMVLDRDRSSIPLIMLTTPQLVDVKQIFLTINDFLHPAGLLVLK